MRAASAIASAKENLSQERVVVLEALLQGSLPPEARKSYLSTQTGQAQALDAFNLVATPAQRALFDRKVAGNNLRPSTVDEGKINGLQSDTIPAGLDPSTWSTDMSERSDLMRSVEQTIDASTVQDATTLRDNVSKQIVIDVGLLFGMVLIAMLIAWSVARSMNRSLRELKQGALTVARHGLPQAVARLRDPALATQMTPAQIALQIAEPLPVRSRDEFGEVTEAFNAVHLEAVRTAAEQAALRSSVATMFVNLARRSQILVDRLIGHLDQLERGEENPDRLAELFQLDHLATRMRRNDENLLVLAGADSTRVQREPASLIDVLRAAQSEVEHYTRVEFGMIDRDIEVAAHAVNDLVHLVAELFDNATAFSPPDAVVLVEARRIGDRAVLYVEDRGIGVSADQLADLNERLATPPIVDVAVSRMMGLVVVARLAYRHGVKVELRPAAERGTIADVLLPTSVLVPRSLVGRGAGPMSSMSAPPALEPMRPPPPPAPTMPAIPPRSPFNPPLALESGPSGGRSRESASNGAGSVGPSSLGGFAANAEAFGMDRDVLRGSSAASKAALPSWSDLTGVGDAPAGGDGLGLRSSGMNAAPLPKRRATEQATDEADSLDDRPRIPRQRPQASAPLDEASLMEEFADNDYREGRFEPSRNGGDRYDDRRDSAYDDDQARPSEVSAPTTAPPVWPPVQTPQLAGGSSAREDVRGIEIGAGPLKSPVDMTAEIPKVRELDLAGAARGDRSPYDDLHESAQQHTGSTAPATLPPFADETMELPIFRELESAWFRDPVAEAPYAADGSDRTSDEQVAAQSAVRISTGGGSRANGGGRTSTTDWPPAAAEPVAASAGAGSTAPGTTMGGANMTGSAASAGRVPSADWRSPADDGWVAAAAASEPIVGGMTEGGLPQRVPMAQLVPGGVEKATTSSNRRSPDAVRGLLSAYHRGVQRGRQQSDEVDGTSESTTTGRNPSGGREQEA